jgi:hypothetical protein
MKQSDRSTVYEKLNILREEKQIWYHTVSRKFEVSELGWVWRKIDFFLQSRGHQRAFHEQKAKFPEVEEKLSSYFIVFFYCYDGVTLCLCWTAASNRPIVHPPNDTWVNMEQQWNVRDGKTKGLGVKPVAVTLCPHRMPWEWNWASAVRTWWLTACVMAWPPVTESMVVYSLLIFHATTFLSATACASVDF